MTEEERDFRELRPAITEETIVKASAGWSQGDGILSLNGKQTAINAFVLLLASVDQTHGPFVMTETCARELCRLLVAEGFQPPAS